MKDIISKRRRELGLTQQQLAEKLNISDKVISKWETGRSLPDTSMLIPLAEALQITINELMESNNNVTEIDKTAAYEADVSYKNTCIIALAIQLVAAIFIISGRVIWDKSYNYGAALSETVALILITFGALCEIAAVTFYLIKRNNLLIKYPSQTDCDKKYLNIILCCTYPIVVAVIAVFIVLHGLSTIEQLIVLLISAAIALLPFLTIFILNNKRKS